MIFFCAEMTLAGLLGGLAFVGAPKDGPGGPL